MAENTKRVRVGLRRWRTHLLLLGLWAVMMWLAFPRPNLHVLAHLALIPLTILAVRGETTRRVALTTFAAGFGWWLLSLGVWQFWNVTWPGWIAVSAYLGLYPMAYALIIRLIQRRFDPPMVLSVPVVWVALEYLRGILITGFPWFLLGHSQPTVMIQIADLFGAYAVSFVVAMTGGLFCDLLTRPLVRWGPQGRRWGAAVKISAPLWLIVITATLGYGVFRLVETGHATGGLDRPAPLTVAVVQTNVPQSNKNHPTPEQDRANFAEAMELSRQAAGMDPDVIVWPETMVPEAINEASVDLYQRQRSPRAAYRRALERFVMQEGIPLIVGAHAQQGWREVPDESTGRSYYMPTHRYNAAYLLTPPAGRVAARYDKLHRVPFGEYIPGAETFEWVKQALVRLSPYETDYTLRKGDEVVLLPVKAGGSPAEGEAEAADAAGAEADAARTAQAGAQAAEPETAQPGTADPEMVGGAPAVWSAAAPICFEDVVSYMPRRMVWGPDGEKRVDVLINMSNDGWFAGSPEGPQHEQIARFRCVENRVPMARAVNTGVSSFIDSAGRVIERVSVDGRTQQVAGVAVAELERDPRRTVFASIGDLLAASCLTLVAALLFALAARRLWQRRQARLGT